MLVALAIAGAITVFAAGWATGSTFVLRLPVGPPAHDNPNAADHELDGPSREGIA